MFFDQLSERLQSAFSNMKGNTLTEENIDEALREVRRAFLEADVSLRVIKAFISRVKDRAIGESVIKNVSPGQQLIKIVNDELTALLGGENKGLLEAGNPNIIVLFGLQGSGKTTSAGKLALKLKKEKKNPLLVAADVYRPAAIQQLITLGKQIDVPVFTIEGSNDVLAIAEAGLAQARADGHSPLIIDTAGRLQIDTDMMAELLLLERSLEPQEKLLVIDAMTGQEAVTVAETFNTQLEVTGLVLSKLDGDARGGAALSIVEITGKPIKFIGMGEKLSALEPFYPERMASRILGMGDIVSLVEKAQENIDLEEMRAMEEKMRKQSFSFEDFMKIQKQMKMLGSLEGLLGMLPIPGMTKEMRQMIAHGGEGQLKKIEAMVNSMTLAERREPDLLLGSNSQSTSRQKRIAKGCGQSEAEVAQFMQQFDMMRMMMKQFSKMGLGSGGASGSGGGAESAGNAGGFGMSMPRSNRKKNKGHSPQDLEKLARQMQGKLPKGGKNVGFPNFPGLGGGSGKGPFGF
ncbi:MAG: signal recognition particle protein [Vampirovibrionales bacterium]|nr:signal recognition particle protein [Vampirovibrionales bacterium]